VSLDVAIRNGRVIDGTGRPSVAADVGIAGELIVAIGEVPAATTEIDAAGLDVVPGFIDVHSHSDYTLLVDPRAVSALHQGVTTEIVGNCGHGCFPVADPALAQGAIYGYTPSLPLTWRDAAGYLEHLESAGPAVNVASLVPNGQLRLATVGLEDRPATRDELAAMERHLEESLEQGAWGFSTGLEYAAERAASPDELDSLCVVCGRSGGLYATHTRHRDVGSEKAVEEALETAERADVRLQVSHLVPRNGIEATRACIDRVERAAQRGLDVAFDMHTRLFGTTFLSAAVPPAFLRSDRLGSAEGRREAVEAMASYTSILSAGDDWSRIVLLDNELWPEYARRDLASIAADRRQTASEAICDLLAAAPEALGSLMVIIHCYTEDQQAEAFQHALCTPGSDATTLAPDGPLAPSFFHGAYTWAAWYLRFMVRERALLSLEEAVKRLTSDPAERVGLRDRGVLRVGAFADVAVLDSGEVRESGTTFEPNRLATGVRHVLVNGECAFTDGALTARRAGKVLRR
jgi:N-acyl-D-amino-acid deacylase